MKRVLTMCLTFIMLFSFSACGSASKEKEKVNNSESVEVDKGLLNVEVTVPVSFVDGQTPDEIKADAEEMGYSDCTIHEDGSVTYKMSKAKHREVLSAMKESFDESIAKTIAEEDGIIKEIKYNDHLSKIDVYVDAAKYDEWDSFSILVYYIIGAYYQIFEGTDAEKVNVIVNTVNAETKEVIDTFNLGDMMEEE